MNTEGKTFQRLCLILFCEPILFYFNRSFSDESEVEFVQLFMLKIIYLHYLGELSTGCSIDASQGLTRANLVAPNYFTHTYIK